MSYNESNTNENTKSNGHINIASEIDRSTGDEIPLHEVKLPKLEGEADILSQKWSSNAATNFHQPVEHFTPLSGKHKEPDYEENEAGETAVEKKDRVSATPGENISNRNKIEAAKDEEPKKSVNPRIVKVVVGVIAVVVVGAVLMLGMKGEKRKSIFAKDKGATTDGTNTTEGTTGTGGTNDQTGGNGDRRAGGLKFGDVAVGSDPNAQNNGKTEEVTPESTEEAKRSENSDPSASVSPTPYPAFMPSYSNYPQNSSGGGNQTGGGIQQTDGQNGPVENNGQSNKNQNQTKTNKGDLAEVPLGLETEEERFRTVMRAGQNSQRQENRNNENNAQTDGQPINNGLPRGTKLELILDEPIRSGIATAVTGKLKKGVTNKRGEILIPKDSMVVVQFSAEIANGRVFNEKEAPIQIVTPEGKSFEVNGMVKDAQGYAGLTGKITKVGGRSTLGKIGGVLGRVGGSLPGGQIITGTQQGIDGMNGSGGYVTNATQIVEVPRGTSFMVIIGF